MKKITLLRIDAGREPLLKMIAPFLVIVSVLMLLQSMAVVFDSWQAVKQFNTCVDKSFSVEADNLELGAVLSELKYQDCKDSLYQLTGAQVTGGAVHLTDRQFWTALLGPVAILFFWCIVFIIAWFLFTGAQLTLPIEEIDVPVRSFGKKR